MYIDMIKSIVSGVVFGEREKSVQPALGQQKNNAYTFNVEKRKQGLDWAYIGDTMTGFARLDNVRDLLTHVIKDNIQGGYIGKCQFLVLYQMQQLKKNANILTFATETGVWRGGSSIFARAVMAAYGATDRLSYVCDSFSGLPPGDRSLDNKDKNWDNTPYLEVSSEIVAGSFNKYGLLDHNVIFAKGFFNETMPVLSNYVDKLAVMRLDVS